MSDRSPAAGLHRTAEKEGASLIVVGGSSRSRLGRVLPGGTAERLLAGAPCPVGIAPRAYARDRDGIVFVGAAFDGSSEAFGALDWAASLARAIPAHLRLLTVNQPLPPATVPAAAGLPLGSVNEERRKELARQLTEAEAAVRDDGLEVTGALLDGDAAAELAKATVHLDLLVLGSRGYGPLRAVVLGSVSNTLVRTASCPVVVCAALRHPALAGGTPHGSRGRELMADISGGFGVLNPWARPTTSTTLGSCEQETHRRRVVGKDGLDGCAAGSRAAAPRCCT